MYASAGTAIGGGLGGALGQVGDLLSAPRRALWGALGLPDSGADLLSQTFGMDPDSLWTKGLGMGAEVALDPLTYSGLLLGGPLGKIVGRVNGAPAAMSGEIEALTAARRAAQEGLVTRASIEGQTVDRYLDQASHLQRQFPSDLPSIAGGRTRSYQNYDVPLADHMANAGMGSLSGEGRLVTLGQNTPRYADVYPMPNGPGGRIHGSQLGPLESNTTPPVPSYHPYDTMDPLLPDELAALRGNTQAAVGNRWRSLRPGANPDPMNDPMGNIMYDTFSGLAREANATRPMPDLLTAMRGSGYQHSGVPSDLLSLPIDQAFGATQDRLAAAIARKRQLEDAARLTGADTLQLAGGAGLGAYLGGLEGWRDR